MSAHFTRYHLFWFGMGMMAGALIVGMVATVVIAGMT